MRYDIEMQNIMTLSQKLVSKKEYRYFKDLAMNLNAHKIVVIDFLIKRYEKFPRIVEFLKTIREIVLRIGEAYFLLEKGDILTHLGLKVGKAGVIEIDGSESSQSIESIFED
jgi:hypothetical protein